MKNGIHPEYKTTVVSCTCGFSFETRSTLPEVKLDICSVCHPFYTGKQMFVDTAGRVEKFQQKFAWKNESSSKVISKAEQNRDEERKRIAAEEDARRDKIKLRKKANEERRKDLLEKKKVQAEEAAKQAVVDEANAKVKAAEDAKNAAKAAEVKAKEDEEKARVARENAPRPVKVREGGPIAARKPDKSSDSADS